MKLFNLDLHISVIADFTNIIQSIFKDKIEITNWSISGHNWVFSKKNADVDIINQNTWKDLNLDMIQKFQEKYDDFLKTFDGFVVTHTPVFSLLFEKYNKPIIIINSCRYEQPFSMKINIDLWNYFDNKLKEMVDNKKVYIVSNNLGDTKYIKIPNIDSEYIPSLCLYTDAIHIPKINNNTFLVYDFNNVIPLNNSNLKMINRYKIQKYQWKEMSKYKAIIHIPYECSTMSIFEHYNMNIPLFFPTKRFIKELIIDKKIYFQSRYIKKDFPDKFGVALSEGNWINFWVDNADYYNENMPYITYFDSIEDLYKKLKEANFDEISNNMKLFNIKKNKEIKDRWTNIIYSLFNL